MDVRPFQYLGTGAFMIMRKFNDMDSHIPDDLYVPFDSYDEPMVVKRLWDEWKYRDTSDMRERAFKYIQEHHSSQKRMENVLKVMNQI